MTKPETEWVLVPRELLARVVNSAHERGKEYVYWTVEAKPFQKLIEFLAASPPAPSVPDVVREWSDLFKEYGTNTPRSTRAKVIGDRMAAALTAQAAEVERLTRLLEGRDDFIVAHQLWDEFVAALPSPPITKIKGEG